jgi:hypothetical protein
MGELRLVRQAEGGASTCSNNLSDAQATTLTFKDCPVNVKESAQSGGGG